MNKKFSLILLSFWISLNAQSNDSKWFSIGSTEKKVLEIQGEPNSVSKAGPYTTFSYGSSRVTFTKGLVDGYNNSGNLKVKMVTTVDGTKKNTNTTKKTNSTATKIASKPTPKKVNKELKWIYYTFISSVPTYNYDTYSGKPELTAPEYSKIYSISGYTFEMEQNLEFCLTKNYKEFNGNSVTLITHIFDSRDLLLISWNNEKGRLSKSFFCSYLNQYGITEH